MLRATCQEYGRSESDAANNTLEIATYLIVSAIVGKSDVADSAFGMFFSVHVMLLLFVEII